MVYSSREEAVKMAKKLVAPTGKGNVDNFISSVKKEKPKFDEVLIVDQFKIT